MSCFCFVWCIHDLYQTLSSAYSAYHQPKPPPQLHREAVIDRWKNRFVPKEFKGWGAKHQKCSPKNTFIFFLNSLPIYVVVVLLMLTSCFLVFLNKKKSTESVNTYKVWPIRTNSCFIFSYYSVWKENHSLHRGFLHIAWKKSFSFANVGYVNFQKASLTDTAALSLHRLAVAKKAAAFKGGSNRMIL